MIHKRELKKWSAKENMPGRTFLSCKQVKCKFWCWLCLLLIVLCLELWAAFLFFYFFNFRLDDLLFCPGIK